MSFNPNTVKLLNEVGNVTNTIILTYPVTSAITPELDIIVTVDLQALGEPEFPKFGLNNSFNEFLSAFKLFEDDYKTSVSPDEIHIESQDGKQSITLITDSLVLLESYDKNYVRMLDSMFAAPSVVEFILSGQDIKNIRNAAGIFKDLSEVIFAVSNSDELAIYLGATNKFNARANNYKLLKTVDSTMNFECKLPIENFKTLPMSDYKCAIKYNENLNKYVLTAENMAFSGFKMVFSFKINQ